MLYCAFEYFSKNNCNWVNVVLITSKSPFLSTKPIKVSRMEFCAAVLSVRLNWLLVNIYYTLFQVIIEKEIN